MRPPHEDPQLEAVFLKLADFCRWRVRFSDSQFLCECTRHKFTFRISTLSPTVLTAAEVKAALAEQFDCIGDWSS